jgi:tRNA G18 (ribose-2'-O)-methylase SpoU
VIHASDPRIAEYAHVGEPGWLLQQGLFVAEGRLVVRRLIEAGSFTIRSILVTPAAQAALADLLLPGLTVHVCEQQTMNTVAGFNFHRGCLALAVRPAAGEPFMRFAGARRLLALEGVGNPDNVGGLFRVAAAFGADGVLLDATSGDPLYRKAIRTSMGASLSVPFAKADPWWPGLRSLRAAGARVLALTPHINATPLSKAVPALRDERLVLLLGAEGAGLSAASLREADLHVRIPIAATVDSLNVAVAAGIALAALGPQE